MKARDKRRGICGGNLTLCYGEKTENIVIAIHTLPPKSLALHDALFKSMDSLTHADSQLYQAATVRELFMNLPAQCFQLHTRQLAHRIHTLPGLWSIRLRPHCSSSAE